MADTKRKTASRAPAARRNAPTPEQKRAARDVPAGPTAKRIERSFSQGSTKSLEEFRRNTLKWD